MNIWTILILIALVCLAILSHLLKKGLEAGRQLDDRMDDIERHIYPKK